MKIHADPTTDGSGIALDVDHPDTLQLFGSDFIPRGVVLTPNEAAELRDELTRALDKIAPKTRAPADVLTDPQPGIGRRLSVDVRGDFRLADASKWRARLTRADLKDSALGRALFSFSRASTSNADQIAKTIAWLDDNPGHPFIVKVSDTVRISDVPPPAA